ncbi:MAG: conjugal transfer protein TraJ [Pseudomonas sp.]|nr:MAG: conjugal transfer protein TraJ [Pseudomonas sp.]
MDRSTGHSTSAYLRKIGLGYPVKSILDYSRVQDLAQVNVDLDRLVGLLKLWLSSDKRMDGYSKEDIRLISLLLKKIDSN